MSASLVGSEMCIRDRCWRRFLEVFQGASGEGGLEAAQSTLSVLKVRSTVSYTHLTLPTICSV
eukprot:7485140-Alexandrium_andersonii.AAC.1